MDLWTCPDCGRQFGRRGQGHECAPAMSVDEYFATGPPWERPIHDAVVGHLTELGDVHVEYVSVGVFVKRGPTFVQLRPMARWVALGMVLPRVVDDDRIARKAVEASAGRWYHVVNLRGPAEVDGQVRDWLTEAFVATGA